jgi:hypothetical protein
MVFSLRIVSAPLTRGLATGGERPKPPLPRMHRYRVTLILNTATPFPQELSTPDAPQSIGSRLVRVEPRAVMLADQRDRLLGMRHTARDRQGPASSVHFLS